MAVPEWVIKADFLRVVHGCPADEWLVSVKMLRRFIDRRERDAVRRARSEGRTLGEIGRCLGISRQAARQRFADLPAVEPESAEDRYFRDLDERHALVTRRMNDGPGLLPGSGDGRLVR